MELGRSARPNPAPGADVVMVRKPWMDPLVSHADLVLTNATSAPVLAALRHDVPLVVAPNGSEQPFLAASCTRAGVAVRLPGEPDQAAGVLSHARGDSRLQERAAHLGSKLRMAGGAELAARIVEETHAAQPPRRESQPAQLR